MTRKADQPTGRDHIDSDLPGGIDRRGVLQLAAGTGAGALLPAGLFGAALAGPAQAAIPGPVYATLKVQMAAVDDPTLKLKLRTYNGKTPGPTLRVQAGGQLQVELVNELKPNPDGDKDNCPLNHNEFHGSNTTNLHTHGLHISPTTAPSGHDADNIFLEVLPVGDTPTCHKETFREHEVDYVFDIVDDHPPGTHWYHAHKHGSTAQQVANGLAGPLIVEDGPGVMPPYIAEAPEKIFMIQMRDLESDETDGSKGTLAIVQADKNGGKIGEINPEIIMRPGAVERWRIINAAPSSEAFLKLQTDPLGAHVELRQIAFDGLTLERRLTVDSNGKDPWEDPAALAPGNRMDIMVRVPMVAPAGRLQLSAAPFSGSIMQDGAFLAAKPASLTIKIEGAPIEAKWSDSDDLPGPTLAEITNEELIDPSTGEKRTRTVKFFLDLDAKPSKAMIDGHLFDGDVRDYKMALNTAEEWTVTNENPFSHPFHIHVNPFFVTHINHQPVDASLRRWQDTIALPKVQADGTPGSVTFRTRFTDFVGKFVIHCHILKHEDEGMMHAVEVVEA